MIQGGDPNGDGTGGSKENIKGEFSNNGVDNDISHTRGTISMARASDPDSASSQFFIVQADSTFLDGDYAGFGHVQKAWILLIRSARMQNRQTTMEQSRQISSRLLRRLPLQIK